MSTETLTCSRKGCGKQYDPATASSNSCAYHPGNVIFHEGLKSYDCCNDLPGHRPVLDFDEFMKIPGCTTGKHETKQAPAKAPPIKQAPPAPSMEVTKGADGKEVYTTPRPSQAPSSMSTTPARAATPITEPKKVDEDEDDLDKPVAPGTKCLRQGCDATFVSHDESRAGDGELAQCQYHPKPPIFHEGSKGYLCCKPKVLEFDEFLKIKGCKTGRHVFVKKVKENAPTNELVQPRIDHYQTPTVVHVTVYAKKVDPQKSKVVINDEEIQLDLYLPDNKRCLQTLALYGSVQPTESSYKIYGTKVEVTLMKQQVRSWSLLEKPATELPEGYGYIFSAGGRTGTAGAKDMILDPDNQLAKNT